MRGLLDALYGVPASVVRSLAVIKKFRPDCVIGLGGYASGPVLLAAKLGGIRCAIMEQNLRPGFTNKILSRMVNRVFTSYGKSVEYFPRARVIETGNPVRWQKLPEVPRRDKFSLLVFGGSAGARRINFAVVDALKQLTDLQSELFVVHQTGELDYAAIKEAYATLPFEAEIAQFIDKMDEAYARADLVLCRAGATTVAELTAFGKAVSLRDLRSSARQRPSSPRAWRRRNDFGSSIGRANFVGENSQLRGGSRPNRSNGVRRARHGTPSSGGANRR